MDTLKLMVTYKTKPGKREAFVKRLADTGILGKIRAEKGCVYYDYYYSEKDPDELLLLEEWESAEDQKVHMDQPHMKELFSFKDDYCENTVLKKYELK